MTGAIAGRIVPFMKTTYEAFLAAAIHSQMPPAQADDLDAGEGGSWVTFGNLWAVRRADGSYPEDSE